MARVIQKQMLLLTLTFSSIMWQTLYCFIFFNTDIDISVLPVFVARHFGYVKGWILWNIFMQAFFSYFYFNSICSHVFVFILFVCNQIMQLKLNPLPGYRLSRNFACMCKPDDNAVLLWHGADLTMETEDGLRNSWTILD